MQNAAKILSDLKNAPTSVCHWRRDSIVRFFKNRRTHLAHFYFPDTSTTPDILQTFLIEKTTAQRPDFHLTPAGVFCPSAHWETILQNTHIPFLIVDVVDVLSNPDSFKKLRAAHRGQKIILYAPDSDLLRMSDKTKLGVDFIYAAPTALTDWPAEKSFFYLETTADFQQIKQRPPLGAGGPFVNALLARERLQKCPFSAECTPDMCARIASTNPLKCADPTFLINTLGGENK